jgi:HK97 family phage portal protein
MSWLNDLGRLLLDGVGPIDVQTRAATDSEAMNLQLAALRRRYETARPWRVASEDEALGVPPIFGAVSLIANTVGSLSLEAFRRGQLVTDTGQIPRMIVRPNPLSTPRAFFRDTAYYLATRGEAWWWIAARDTDGSPLSLYPVPPWEIRVSRNEQNRLRPTIEWGTNTIRNEDIRQITYLPGRDGLRGMGPLQECGAAVSVSVEAQEWAASFYSGSLPSIIGTTEQDLTEDEAKALDAQWSEKPPNMPRWLPNGVKMTESPFDPQKAQLTESRQYNVGDVARMFNVPGTLIEYQMAGSSLTYNNQSDIWQDFQRRCLSPHYLEPIEQEISDLLTRSTVARFNLKQLLRAAPKERMEVHALAITNQIYDADTAAKEEGYAPGNVDYAPVPLAPPQAIPARLPVRTRSELADLHCPKCRKLVGKVNGGAEIRCPRCGTMAVAA